MKRLLFITLGFTCLGLGIIGAFLPVMPTTPFVLLAAVCFSRSSKKFSDWIERSPFFGPFIENYRNKTGISASLKAISITILWAGLLISMVLANTAWISILLVIAGASVTIHILSIKNKEKSDVPFLN